MTTATQLSRMADVLDAGAQAPPAEGRLAPQVLHALSALVPCDALSFNDLEPATATTYVEDDLDGDGLTQLQAPAHEPGSPFWQHYLGSLPCSYPTRSGDHRTVTLRSDFCSTAEWKRSPMYCDVLSEWGADLEMMLPLPPAGGRSRRVVFFRSGTTDFTEQDRFALALLRPHLAELVSRRVESVALTERQSELMQLVANGRSNAEIAAELHLSPHTVRTHLMNIYERLGVTTRAAAVARVLAGT
jgi:DNA-binding CsgD family transcriptional regulator